MAETDAQREERLRQEAADRAAAERIAALEAYEAQHAAVHASAIAVLNIKVLVPSFAPPGFGYSNPAAPLPPQ
jgi:hypothetical protein